MKRYGLIGRTLTHSFSKSFFTKKFEEERLPDYCYDNFELATLGEFLPVLAHHPDLQGLNVTIPYKEEVLPFLSEKNEIVEAIGACNCIKVEGKKLTGYNTDVLGFTKSIEPQLKSHHKKALVLGTGGASKAVVYALQQLGIAYSYVSRIKQEGGFSYDDLGEEILHSHHLIVNTTPLGMWPAVDAAPALPYHLLTPAHFLFDIIYNPAKTEFLARGEKYGAQICNGYEMLLQQAEESWRIWRQPEG